MKKAILFIFTCIIALSVANSQDWKEIQKALPQAYLTNKNDYYGQAVAVSDSTAVVGVPGYKESQGCAYVLQYVDDEWLTVAKLTAFDGEPGDLFGCSVSISGATVVIGAYRHYYTHGAAYIFEKPVGGWTDMVQTAKIESSWEATEAFGASVDISGVTIIVGAYMNYLNGSRSGSAYVFEKPAEGWTDTTETARLLASDGGQDDYFGNSVCISGDNIAVGAYGYGLDQTGSVYIFEKPVGGWTDTIQTAKLTISDTNTIDYFGYSVDMSDETLVVGAYNDTINSLFCGSAYVFEKPLGGWADTTETAKLTASDLAEYDNFGYSVSISGGTIVVGAYGDSLNAGSAYIFEKPTTGWKNTTQTAKLYASDMNTSDLFGRSVNIFNKTIIIGAHANDDNGKSTGSAYFFEKPLSGWQEGTETQKALPEPYESNISDKFGSSIAIDGEFAVVGSKGYNADQGCAYLLNFNGNEWQILARLTASDGEANDNFGCAVDISGETVTVGASVNNKTGSVYVFEKPADGWKDTFQTAKLIASDGTSYGYFGTSVGISDETIIIGASTYSADVTSSGVAYIFEKPAGGWKDTTQTAKLTADDSEVNDHFGNSVAISGETVVIGSYGNNSKGYMSGSAYIFEKPASGWKDTTQSAKLTASDGTVHDYLGRSVAISGETVIAGAYGDDDNGDITGSVYVFEKPSEGWEDMTQTAKLTVLDTTDFTYFSSSLGISGKYIVAGAFLGVNEINEKTGAIYVFEKPEKGWTDTTETITLLTSDGNEEEYFGYSVDISGNYIVAGSFYDDDIGTSSGSAYLFVNNSFIRLQPEDVSIYEGENTSFSVSGIIRNSYRWQVNEGTGFTDVSDNNVYSGATAENLDITGASLLMDGFQYRCIVSLGSLHDTSNTATLTVMENIIGIPLLRKTGITVFPNPTTGKLYFQSEDNVIQCIKVFDLTGKTLFETEDIQIGDVIDLSVFDGHIYFVYIQTENKTGITKIIKQ